MMFPLAHGIINSPSSGAGFAYPVSDGLVALWDSDGYVHNSSYTLLPDLSGNGNDLDVTFDSLFNIDESGVIGTNNKTGRVQDLITAGDIKNSEFTIVIRTEGSTSQSSAFRYAGFNPTISGDPSYMIAADNSMRFNNGSQVFAGDSGLVQTICVVNYSDATYDVYVDAVKVVNGVSSPTGALIDNFEIGGASAEVFFKFAAVHEKALSQAQVSDIHAYSMS